MLPEHYNVIQAFCTSDNPEEFVSGYANVVDAEGRPMGTLPINTEDKHISYFVYSKEDGTKTIAGYDIATVYYIELVKHSAKGKCHLSIDTKQR